MRFESEPASFSMRIVSATSLLLFVSASAIAQSAPPPDAFVNAAMLVGGMGPVDPLRTTAGKWLAGAYALFAGVVFLVLAGVMLVPVVHHVLEKFHLESGDKRDAGT